MRCYSSRATMLFDLARNFDKVICNTIACWPAVAQLHDAVNIYWYVHESELIRDFVERISPALPRCCINRDLDLGE